MVLHTNPVINSERVKLYKINISRLKGNGEKLTKVLFKLYTKFTID